MRLLITIFLVISGAFYLEAQVPKDITLPVTATINASPASITLNWPNAGNANILVGRRTKGQSGTAWVQVLNVSGSNLTGVMDNGVASGQIYEYFVQVQINGLIATGYAHVALNANPVNSRGKILIFVDSTTADATGPELVRLKNDMRGDGWWPIPFHTGPSSTVQSIKNQIIASYNADPINVKAVLLIGNVPIPYSGNTNWDGHPDHLGAWPADVYYGDVNGVWTDNSVNNTTPARDANDNVPGDGKFDQDIIPSPVELQVGRIDFRHIDPAAFGAANQAALLKRYLEKNHRWRIGQYTVGNKALVDDNFGYFNGEAFAENGFRNAYPLVGAANVIEGDFFNDTDSQSFLMGYGCGGGWYDSAAGVGSSANFATDSVNIVFSNLFGSYHGDWDYEVNPFMPAALASRGGILTCSWAGRPHHFYQALASGETMGYVMLETMNAVYNNGFFGSYGESGAHVALLGDPTLRANVIKPASNLSATATGCHNVTLAWTASPDAVAGYHIYRAPSQDGPYTRLTTTPVSGTSYIDNAPPIDTLYYQVRAIKNVTTPAGGTYANNAIGPIKSIVFTGAGGPTLTATGGTLNCTTFNIMLVANATPASITSWNWSGPGNFSSSLQNPTVSNPGSYTVTATDANGCSAIASAIVDGDYSAPTILANVSNTINCIQQSATITVDQTGLASCTITGPNGFFVQGFSATVTQTGPYSITVVSAINGCIGNSAQIVVQDITPPAISADNDGDILCNHPTSQLEASSNIPDAVFVWTGPCVANGNIATCPGIYTVQATNPGNGCTSTASTIVGQNTNVPSVTALGGVITCETTEITLAASWTPANASAQWSGPCLVPGNPPKASCAGTYTVVVTDPANGCTAMAAAVVTEDKQVPNISLPPLPEITCANPCVTLTVPNLPGIQFYYAGQPLAPGFSLDICQPGIFPIQAKSLTNGCTSDVNLVIGQNTAAPNVNAGADKTLSCNTPSAQLNGSSSTVGAQYSWTGPGGFTSNLPNPTVTVAGNYTLEVTDPVNGCVASDNVTVAADPSLPSVDPTVSGVLNCAVASVTLSSGNTDPSATYAWSGPNGFSSSQSNPTVSEPGSYTIVVSVGACTATGAVLVNKAPDFVVSLAPILISCDGTVTECLNIDGGTQPYNIHWSNGSTTECAVYSGPGSADVSVSVTDAGGCIFQNTHTVPLFTPMQIATTFSPSCTGNSWACVTVSGGTAPYTVLWSNGATGFCAAISAPGLISLTVTDANGCTVSSEMTIVFPPSIITSVVITNESAPNAHDGSIDLTVTGGTGVFSYSWSNGANTEDLNNLPAGNYVVIVADVNTGCTSTVSCTVQTSTGATEAAYFERLNLSPNPTDGLTMLSLSMHKAGAVRVEIRDVAGRLILEKPAVEVLKADIPLDLSQSPAGMYTVSVWVEDQVFVRKLAIVR